MGRNSSHFRSIALTLIDNSASYDESGHQIKFPFSGTEADFTTLNGCSILPKCNERFVMPSSDSDVET
jgi:hypothetical protein